LFVTFISSPFTVAVIVPVMFCPKLSVVVISIFVGMYWFIVSWVMFMLDLCPVFVGVFPEFVVAPLTASFPYRSCDSM